MPNSPISAPGEKNLPSKSWSPAKLSKRMLLFLSLETSFVFALIAASAAFSTPVSTPVSTLVVEPGRYGFMDFVKIGVPLLLTYLATALVAPLVFPFAG